VSVVCVCSRCNILISGKIIKEMPGSVASGTHCIIRRYNSNYKIFKSAPTYFGSQGIYYHFHVVWLLIYLLLKQKALISFNYSHNMLP